MKKYINLATWVIVAGLLGSGGLVAHLHAQGSARQGRIDAFTFLIPYPADILDDQFNIGQSTSNLINDDIEIIISIAVHRDHSIIYYDQWEDGLESDLTTPVQPSTQIWGDNNPANGIPPLFPTDTLNAGDVIILRNIVPLPRDPITLFFDGGDTLTSVGGAIAATLTFWSVTTNILFTDAWELYPTNQWGEEYIIPVGENLRGNGPNQRRGFRVVGLNVQALADGTRVELDLNGDGTFELIQPLNYGEQHTEISGVQVGARVRASAPVQVHLFTADPARTYEARGYTMVPLSRWTGDYLAPRSSDGDFWLYNPDPANPLQVKAETVTATTLITIPANQTVKFPAVGLSAATGIHFTASFGQPFFGLAVLDEADAQDWGYALLPMANLTTQKLVGLGLGNNRNPGPPPQPDGDQSRVYVTARTTTTLQVDYNDDGIVDTTFPITPLAEVPVTDPTDHDLTGAFLFTADGVPLVAVWGQDQSAEPAQPSIDAGANIVTLQSLTLQKTFTLMGDQDCSGTITPGDTVRFKLQFFNDSANSISNILIEDDLPATVTYVPHSTTLNGVLLPDDDSGTPFPLDAGGYHLDIVEARATGFLTFDTVINQTVNEVVNRADIRSLDLPLETDFTIIIRPIEASVSYYQVSKTLLSPPGGPVIPGQVITFGLTITNTGALSITSLPLQDTFDPAYLTFLRTNLTPTLVTSGVISWHNLIPDPDGYLSPQEVINLSTTFAINTMPVTEVIRILNTAETFGPETGGTTLPYCSDTAVINIIPTLTPTSPTSTPTATPTPPTSTATPTLTPTPTSATPGPTWTPVSPTATPSTPTPVAISPLPSPTPDNDVPPRTPTPRPAAPPVPGLVTTPGPTSTGLPVLILPETGSRATASPEGITMVTISLLALLGLSVMGFWWRQRSKL